MSVDTFAGLRPVAKKRIEIDLNRKTNRIVLPSPVGHGDADLAINRPPRVIPIPTPALKPVVKKRFALVPVAPSLHELFPHGIFLTSQWIFIGSKPAMEIPAFTALVLNLDGISKVHAAVMEFNEVPFVIDMDSTNGTRILRDQKAIDISGEPVELLPGDILWIGSVFFHLVQS